jgi:hypothetical protein
MERLKDTTVREQQRKNKEHQMRSETLRQELIAAEKHVRNFIYMYIVIMIVC